MNYREQFEKETDLEYAGCDSYYGESDNLFTEEYVVWLESKLEQKDELLKKREESFEYLLNDYIAVFKANNFIINEEQTKKFFRQKAGIENKENKP